MGLSNDAPVSGKFINLKKGKLIAQVDGEKKEFTTYTGFVVELDLEVKEYNGKEYEAVILSLQDEPDADGQPGKVYELSMDLESGYANAFCSMSPNIDFGKPVSISAGIEKLENGNEFGKLFIRQDGQPLKWFFTKDGEHKTPPPVVQTDRNGTYNDYSAKVNFFRKMLIEKIRPAILNKKKPAGGVTQPDAKTDNKTTQGKTGNKTGRRAPAPATQADAISDDLPF